MRQGQYFGARPGGHYAALGHTEQMRHVAGQVFEARRNEQHPQGRGHEPFEDGVEMGAGGGIQPGERLVQNEQAHGMRERPGQLDSLPLAIGQGEQRAVEEGRDLEQRDGAAHAPLELRSCLAVPGGDLERVDVHHALVGKVVADERGAFLFQAVPARLDDGVVDFGFAVLEGDMADGFLGRQPRRRAEMIAQFAVHERQAPAQGVGQEGFARAIGAKDGPVLVPLKHPGGVLEDDALPKPEGSVPQGQERLRAMRLR